MPASILVMLDRGDYWQLPPTVIPKGSAGQGGAPKPHREDPRHDRPPDALPFADRLGELATMDRPQAA